MRDVALQAGVSTSTVSRALMRPEKVSSATRQCEWRVASGEWRVACSIGYTPLAPGRLIKRDESAMFLELVSDSGSSNPSEVLSGIQETASVQGYFLLLSTVHTDNLTAAWRAVEYFCWAIGTTAVSAVRRSCRCASCVCRGIIMCCDVTVSRRGNKVSFRGR